MTDQAEGPYASLSRMLQINYDSALSSLGIRHPENANSDYQFRLDRYPTGLGLDESIPVILTFHGGMNRLITPIVGLSTTEDVFDNSQIQCPCGIILQDRDGEGDDRYAKSFETKSNAFGLFWSGKKYTCSCGRVYFLAAQVRLSTNEKKVQNQPSQP